MLGRGLKATDLYKKDIYWQFIAEWFGCYEDINKLTDSVLNVTYNQIKKQENLLNWSICALNTYIPISEFIKHVFKNRKNPQDSDHQYHQKRIQESLIH